ncbi:MAG: NAD(P)-binding domain-containing protein [Albidovulum sp.]|nr:NAD(P)-binding domain-containing protein [Albidovulum sp.]
MGIVGYGAIGERMAALAAAFGLRVVEFDSERAKRISRQVWKRVALAELLEECDLATLHVPLTDTTRNMIDAAALASMKQGNILVNAAREGFVDEVSLVDAVDSVRLQGTGHDKFDVEPPGESFAVARCNGILLSPQIAGATYDSALRMSMFCAEYVEQFLMQGTRRDDLVNYAWDALC